MDIDSINNQATDSDDPTLELEPLSEAACDAMMQADDAPDPDAVADTEVPHEIRFESSAPGSDNIASEIQELRDKLKYRADMNTILRHRNEQLHERCDRLEEQVSSLLKTSEALSNELEQSHQQVTTTQQQLAEVQNTEKAPLMDSRIPDKADVANTAVKKKDGAIELQTFLVQLSANGVASDTWVLHDGVNTIGSSPDCDVRIQSRFISRHHAQLIKTQTGSILEDLNSTNGSYINSRRINKRAIRAGDLVIIGKHRLQYREQSGRPAATGSRKFGSGLQSATT